MTWVKICGITNFNDADAACDAGADALGFIFAPSSRMVDVQTARSIVAGLPQGVEAVGVFVNDSVERIRQVVSTCRLTRVQLHGSETPEFVSQLQLPTIKSFAVRDSSVLEEIPQFDVDMFLLDTFSEQLAGGTGRTFDWDIARKAAPSGRLILSGGLTPDNITEALGKVRPYGVDVSSGVEKSRGIKDHEKIKQFINKVRTWDNRINEDISVSSADDSSPKR